MAENTEQAKKAGHDGLSTWKKRQRKVFRPGATQKKSRTVKAYRKRYKIGLQAGREMTFEELYKHLSDFTAQQWEQLPTHASDWERGQVDGLFWALKKLDEIVEG